VSAAQPIRTVVNGIAHEREVDARLLLVDLLRAELGLTGVHSGCDDGLCGACTVTVDGQPVKSCLMLAVQADGTEITTVEGLGTEDDLHPVQQAFIDAGAVQCGFCTPGFVVAASALLERTPAPSDQEIREGLIGNLCRCGCYQNIRAAVTLASTRADGNGAAAPAAREA
jgi:carbon-monoxide dehydrogenase small subunit